MIMTTHTLPLPAPSALARISRLAGAAVLRVVELIHAWKSRRDMQLLSGFDDRMLRDIGLTRGDLRDAVAEPLWRDPTAILVNRVCERRVGQHPVPAPKGPRLVESPPLAPVEDVSSQLFPARSRYY
jgi:uncharacterized protein YjiS (DUF1127 family)